MSQSTLDQALKEEEQQQTDKSTEFNTEDAVESDILMSGAEEEHGDKKSQLAFGESEQPISRAEARQIK